MRLERVLLCLAVYSACSSSAAAFDWPQFLGPQRNGISAETDLLSNFPATGPIVQWRTDLGTGQSGIAVSEGMVCTLFQNDGGQYAVALDEASGDRKWISKVADTYQNAMGNGPRATPVVADHVVYVFTGEGILTALALDSGDIKWAVNTTEDLGSEPAGYGMASSPLVSNGNVVVHIGSEKGMVAAYKVESGETAWVAGSDACGYSSPVQMTLGGTDQIVTFSGESAMGISADSGKMLWQHSFVTDYDCNIATPIQVDHSSLLISAGENHGAVLVSVTESADGWTVDETWSSLGKRSVLRAEWQTPVLHNGHLFGLDNVGAAGPITNLVCVNASTGESIWSKKRFGKSNLTLADGKLFVSTMNGEVVIVEATTDGFREMARADVLGMTRQAPVIANGRLYLRDDKEIVCIDIRAKS